MASPVTKKYALLLAVLALGALRRADAHPAGPAPLHITIPAPDGTPLAATVFRTGLETPVIVAGHGSAKARLKDLDDAETVPDRVVRALVEAGFNVVTYDRRGFGDSGGEGQFGDPALDGGDLNAVLDRIAEGALVPQARRGPDGRLVLGYSAYSMGADPVALMTTDRFGAMLLGISFSDMTDAMAPGGKPYQGWLTALLLLSRRQDSVISRDIRRLTLRGLRQRALARMPEAQAFLRERSLDCAAVKATDAAVLLMPGVNDTLYPLNHAARTFRCLRDTHGQDVRLVSQEKGHIIPGEVRGGRGLLNAIWPVENGFTVAQLEGRMSEAVYCPEAIGTPELAVRWFAAHLAPELAEPLALPPVCLSVGAEAGVVLSDLPSPGAPLPFEGVAVQVSNADLTADALSRRARRPGVDAPVFVPLVDVAEARALAGIPRVSLRFDERSAREARLRKLAVFVGIGVRRAGEVRVLNGQWQPFLINGGPYEDAELRGVGALLAPGDTVGLVISGHDVFFDGGAILTRGGIDKARVTIAGAVALPRLPPWGDSTLLIPNQRIPR
ncbi:MAG: hypothetical protein H6739_00760 [Alphaproteobacteria bacterium]|nr:hypothetical protein [Alphaproteobacteria bacterium]